MNTAEIDKAIELLISLITVPTDAASITKHSQAILILNIRALHIDIQNFYKNPVFKKSDKNINLNYGNGIGNTLNGDLNIG